MADKNFIVSPLDSIAGQPPADYKGGPGVYNGEAGFPPRTPSPNAAPEKMRDSLGEQTVPDKPLNATE